MAATILCVDDDRNFCQILSRAFSSAGYGVEMAHDGETALAKVRECSPDLVTLDILLPKRDGFQVLDAIRRQEGSSGQIPVVLFSGCTITPAYREQADRLHANAVLKKPVPLKVILELVSKELGMRGQPTRNLPPRAAPVKKKIKPMELSGSFEEVPFPALLHHLHGLRATGVLQLQSGKKKKQLQIDKGHPVAVRSNLVDECLGNLLLSTGKITSDVLHESIQRMHSGEGPQGQILVAMHMLDEEDLAMALRNQAEEKLFEIFTWRKGSFQFRQGVRLRDANALFLKRSPADLIMEGVGFRVPLEQVDRFLRERAQRYCVRGESPFYRFQDINLDAGDEALLNSLDAGRPLAALLKRDEATRRALYALITLEMIDLRDAPTGSPTTPRQPPKTEAREKPEPAPRQQPKTAPRERPAPAPLQQAEAAPRQQPKTAPRERPEAAPPRRQPPPRPAPRRITRPPSPREIEDRGDEGLRVELAEMAEKLRGRDYFEILGVARDAGEEQIRAAYVDLAKRTHPDRFSGASAPVRHLAEEIFGLISRAHETLSDRDRRLEYLRDRGNQARDAAELEEGQRALRAELEFQKGRVCLKRKSYQKAVAHFEEAVNAYPEEGEYHAYYGWAMYLDNPERLKEALGHVLAGRKLAPAREKPYLFLGRLYKAADRGKLAEKMFTRAVQLDPDCVDALRELRLLNMRREKSRGLVRRMLRR